MLKFDAEKKANADFEIDFWVNFGAVRGERGVAEFKLRLQADFNSRFTRPAPQAGVRRMKIYAQTDPKSHPKIDIWAIRGSIFEVLGGFGRSLIFAAIWDVQKVDQK